MELATTLVCSLILIWLDYCNSLLHGAPASSIQVLQCSQDRSPGTRPITRTAIATPAVLAAGSSQIIDYKLAVMTYNIHSTNIPRQHIKLRRRNARRIYYWFQAFRQNRVCQA